MPYCIVCGNSIGNFFVCQADMPHPASLVEKRFCNTCGELRTDKERKFTQCPACYQKWRESEAREREMKLSKVK